MSFERERANGFSFFCFCATPLVDSSSLRPPVNPSFHHTDSEEKATEQKFLCTNEIEVFIQRKCLRFGGCERIYICLASVSALRWASGKEVQKVECKLG